MMRNKFSQIAYPPLSPYYLCLEQQRVRTRQCRVPTGLFLEQQSKITPEGFDSWCGSRF